jgi:hypothetical protein
MTATFRIDQPAGAGPGSPGEARRDIWLGKDVTLTALDLSPGGYTWEFLPGGVPPGSTAVINNNNQQMADFTPDLPGSYRVRLLWNGGGPGRVSTKIIRVTKDSFGSLTKRGWGYPAFDERPDETNFVGNARGYSPEFELILDDILLNSFGGGGGSAGGDLAGSTGVPVVARIDGAYIASNGLGLAAGTALQVVPGSTNIADVSAIKDMTGNAMLVTRKGANDAVIYKTSTVGELTSFSAVASVKYPQNFNPNASVSMGGKAYAIGAAVGRFATIIQILRADTASGAVEAIGTVALPGATRLVTEVGSGSLWALDGSASIYRIDPTTFAVTTVALPTAVRSNDIFDANGVIYATGDAGKIWRIDPSTNTVTSGTAGISDLYSQAGGAGYVWATDGSNIYRIDGSTLTVSSTLAVRAIAPQVVVYQPSVGVLPDYVYALSADGLTIETVTNPTSVMAEDVTNVLPVAGARMAVSGEKMLISLPDRVAAMASSSGGMIPPVVTNAAGVADWRPIVPYATIGATLTGPSSYSPTNELPESPIPVILTDSTAGIVTVLLSALAFGRVVVVKDISPAPMGTVLDGAGDMIDGQPTRTFVAPYESITLFKGPTEWSVI